MNIPVEGSRNNALEELIRCASAVIKADDEHELEQSLIEALRKALQEVKEPEPVVVAVVLQGGVCQKVVSSMPMQYIVVDYDTEGADPSRIFSLVSEDGVVQEAMTGSRHVAECNPDEIARIAAGMEASLVYLTYDEWCDKFKPIQNTVNGNAAFSGTMFETFGDELQAVLKATADNPACVWTLQEGEQDELLCDKAGYAKGVVDGIDQYTYPGGEPVDSDFIGDGYHTVNRMGYFITKVPAEPGVFYVIHLDDGLSKAAKQA